MLRGNRNHELKGSLLRVGSRQRDGDPGVLVRLYGLIRCNRGVVDGRYVHGNYRAVRVRR